MPEFLNYLCCFIDILNFGGNILAGNFGGKFCEDAVFETVAVSVQKNPAGISYCHFRTKFFRKKGLGLPFARARWLKWLG